jgi:hypothetical protein
MIGINLVTTKAVAWGAGAFVQQAGLRVSAVTQCRKRICKESLM